MWKDALTDSGYGHVTYHQRQWKASRLAWALAKGPVPEGLWVLHKCDNPPCCNPGHLYLGTLDDNTRDMMTRRRHASQNRTGYMPSGDEHPARKHPERMARGEQNGSARLTAGNVLAIRAEWDAGGMTLAALAARYGVAKSTINFIVQRKTWRHLPETQGEVPGR